VGSGWAGLLGGVGLVLREWGLLRQLGCGGIREMGHQDPYVRGGELREFFPAFSWVLPPSQRRVLGVLFLTGKISKGLHTCQKEEKSFFVGTAGSTGVIPLLPRLTF